jgi:hypothetical protein
VSADFKIGILFILWIVTLTDSRNAAARIGGEILIKDSRNLGMHRAGLFAGPGPSSVFGYICLHGTILLKIQDGDVDEKQMAGRG